MGQEGLPHDVELADLWFRGNQVSKRKDEIGVSAYVLLKFLTCDLGGKSGGNGQG